MCKATSHLERASHAIAAATSQLDAAKAEIAEAEAESPEADEDTSFTNGIPSVVFDAMQRGQYSERWQAAMATAAAMRADNEALKLQLAGVRGTLAATEHIVKAKQKRLDYTGRKIMDLLEANMELQAAKPDAPSSKTMPEKRGLYWASTRMALTGAPACGSWNALLLVTGYGPNIVVKLYAIHEHSLVCMHVLPDDLVFSPRIGPPQVVLPEPESETP